MTTRHGYIETQNPSLRSLVVGDHINTDSSSYPVEARSTKRIAMISDLYGPFREDSMELKEEKAYQRGMQEHIRESMEGLGRLGIYQDTPSSPPTTPRQGRTTHRQTVGANYSAQGDFAGRQSRATFIDQQQEANVWEDLSTVYRPKPTYCELGQKVSTRPLPPPPRTYTKFFNTPKTYMELRTRGSEQELNPHSFVQTGPSFPVGMIQNGQTGEGSVYGQNHGSLTNRVGYHLSPPHPHPQPHPVLMAEAVPVVFPILGQPVQGYGGYYGNGYDRNQGNGDPKKLSVDINVNMMPSKQEVDLDQNGWKDSGGAVAQGGSPSIHPLVPPLSFHLPQKVSSVPNDPSQPSSRQPWTDRPTTGQTIYPYRTMKNPWFPKQENFVPPPPPSVRHHYRRGKYGYYRVFDINDFKKLQKEMRLGSLVGSDKDTETIEDKKEKKAILFEYGRLIRAKNKDELKPNYYLM